MPQRILRQVVEDLLKERIGENFDLFKIYRQLYRSQGQVFRRPYDCLFNILPLRQPDADLLVLPG